MIDPNFQRIISELLSKKSYNEVILKVEEHSNIENRPGGLSSLIGVCKMLKPNYTEEDVKIFAFKNIKTYSFEPKLENFNLLEKNTSINNFSNDFVQKFTK